MTLLGGENGIAFIAALGSVGGERTLFIHGRVPNTRELVIDRYPYVVPYRVVGDELQVLRVLHARRKPPKSW